MEYWFRYDMSEVFMNNAVFNQDIGGWDTSRVNGMSRMFRNALSFNQDIGGWDISSVGVLGELFRNAVSFNQDISNWDTSNVFGMSYMFFSASSFNQDISSWDTGGVIAMLYMFAFTTYNYNLSAWCVSQINTAPLNFALANPSLTQKSENHPKWGQDCADEANWGEWSAWTPATNTDTSVVDLSQTRTRSCVVTVREMMDMPAPMCTGDSSQTQTVTNPLAADTATYSAWGNWSPAVSADTAVINVIQSRTRNCEVTVNGNSDNLAPTCSGTDTETRSATIGNTLANGKTVVCANVTDGTSFSVSGTTYVKRNRDQINPTNAHTSCTTGITDMSDLFRVGEGYTGTATFNGDISHWDTRSVSDMSNMFNNAGAFNNNIGDWDTSSVIDMNNMFSNAFVFNRDIGNWDTSSVTDMSYMFNNALAFNQDIGNWNTSSVIDMSYLFNTANTFNQDIGGWDISSVTSTIYMFTQASAFNQNIGDWETDAVADMQFMFWKATVFNQDLNAWCVDGINSAPSNFGVLSALNADNQPNWGASCILDTAAWSAWTAWTPSATNTDTSVVDIMQTRSRSCEITIVGGVADDPAPTCIGSTSTMQTEYQTVTNTLAADTATWSDWSQWTPAANTDTSVVDLLQTRTRSCMVMIIGNADNPAPTCSGDTSETQTISNPQAADTAIWSAWTGWSPISDPDTSVIEIIQSRTRSCMVLVIGNADDPAPLCTGSTNQTRTITNPLAADSANWGVWSDWSPAAASNTDTSVLQITQFRTRSCIVTPIGNTDVPPPICSGVASATRNIDNPNYLGLASNGVTIVCKNATVGTSFDVSATSFIKRNKNDITVNNAATSCTSGITDMSNLFRAEPGYSGTASFNGDISHWDTSSVADMNAMFRGASAFNSDISAWDTSKVIDMNRMFVNTAAFNQNIGIWDTSSVTNMEWMFWNATAFNGNIGTWNTAMVMNMSNMFNTATAFNQDLSGWCVSQLATPAPDFAVSAPAFTAAKPNWGAACNAGKILQTANQNLSESVTPVFISENWQDNQSPSQNYSENYSENAAENSNATEQSASFQQISQCLQQGDSHWLSPTATGDLFDQNHSYRWGTEVYGDWDLVISYANSDNICGFNNWRVPTAAELQQLYADAGNFSKLQTLIPNILAQAYWSSNNSTNTALTVNLSNGLSATIEKYSYQKLILIRTE